MPFGGGWEAIPESDHDCTNHATSHSCIRAPFGDSSRLLAFLVHNDVRALLRYLDFASWQALLTFMKTQLGVTSNPTGP